MHFFGHWVLAFARMAKSAKSKQILETPDHIMMLYRSNLFFPALFPAYLLAKYWWGLFNWILWKSHR